MSVKDDSAGQAADIFTEMLRIQGEAARQVMETFLPEAAEAVPGDEVLADWGASAMRIQQMWEEFHRNQQTPESPLPFFVDPAQWMGLMQGWYQQMPLLDPERQRQIFEEGMALWEDILARFEEGGEGGAPAQPLDLPRKDRRFAAPEWRERPVFALIHQTYLLLAERISEAVDQVEGLDEQERDQLRFATRSVLDAMSPANFPLMNPLVLERTIDTQGENLARGMERLAADLEKGQLTHTDSGAFRLGENIACTPGKVVHETELFQLIQYSPTTDEVIETPLVIFPPWINRFYILDLNPKKSFVRWAVDQGLSVFVVSWRSADASLAHITWDDYIRAQMEVIELVRQRLKVPSVHTVGYCVAGTTLAATLAILARRGKADHVASATFLTAQVDFERAGELRAFIDDKQLELIRQASKGGYLDGRYMAATFNLLRGTDLIWNYVVNHYLLGEDYPAFDLLHWNGDVTNLPAKWHESYLRDLYRDNRLAEKDSLSGDGTPIDLTLIKTPVYVQAGREDHIAPPESVFRMLSHLSGPARFVLAGSGHIAGVVNPPAAGKYQYWIGDSSAENLGDFVEGATEHPGSWWTDWIGWLELLDGKRVPATGKRKPGGRGDRVIEDAPGRYVAMR
ncbi:polyhydroxyalkanoate synthase [Altererythrobacter atlanticus]|uniref:Poly-beta-hydroxybutyrate polymerase n=1 Tax=Croceibacterium atlanticum TaxID=1267766 RepID=A0A0F7KSN7_9SPHN|nr:class I poly(R)-hydroxyalkanoic acid synthase [Croceibacterium atlanticum]AKH42599.1 Poly-beta-hydroxybutyrate polymerase [Croceibacterium atlanticum]MBB5731376.1 polyhydroxyalkanoate synthase [Croceibacterium atlanticum]